MTQPAEHLTNLDQKLDHDLREAKRQLQLSREEALEELKKQRDSLEKAARQTLDEVEKLTGKADHDLSRIQRRLGELSLLLAEQDMDNPETLDKFRERVLGAMDEAREDIDQLKSISQEWSDRGTEIDHLWRKLYERILLARLHLAEKASQATDAFQAEREALLKELDNLEESKSDTSNFRARLKKIGKKFDLLYPWTKAFFQHPDEASPAETKEQQVKGKETEL